MITKEQAHTALDMLYQDKYNAEVTVLRQFIDQQPASKQSAQAVPDGWEFETYKNGFWFQAPDGRNAIIYPSQQYVEKLVFDLLSELTAAPTTAANAAQDWIHDSEKYYAIRQGSEIGMSNEYFKARPQTDTLDRRRVFESGFTRGFDAAIRAMKTPAKWEG